MHYSLSNALGRPYVSGIDADAKAYIDAIVAAGATVTGSQRAAINEFVVAEKDASRWAGLKRMYLPVWGVAAANAICMKSLTSGTFVGGVTHAAGYVQGNGSTGYFDVNQTRSQLSLSSSNGMLFNLITENATGSYQDGLEGDSGEFIYLGNTGPNNFGSVGEVAVLGAGNEGGINVISRTASNSMGLYSRKTSGFSTVGTNSFNETITIQDINPFFLATNQYGIGSFAHNRKEGVFGVGSGLSAANAEAYTLNIKTLWETISGLSLP